MSKITKIVKIENFGIFKNFDWDANLKYQSKQGQDEIYDFKDINILYGRNYSGKTSLSKIIRSLEKRAIPSKYDQPEFKIELSDGSIISQDNLSTFSYPIHVYNSDFVKENLKFIHDDNQNIESFSVTLGGDNQKILDRIQELKNELGTNEENNESELYLAIKNKNSELEAAIKAHKNAGDSLEELLKKKASGNSESIRSQPNLFGDQDYNIGKLKRNDIPLVTNSNYQSLTNEKELELRNILDQRELASPPNITTYSLNLPSIIKSIDETLKTVVGDSTKIEELVNSSTLNTWVQTGHQLHTDRTICLFCSNEISNDRREKLRNHFDQETQNLQKRISKGIEYLISLLEGENFKISFDINHYYQQYHADLLQLQSNLQTALDKQKITIKQLQTFLEEKNSKLFTQLQTEYPNDYSEEIKTTIDKINQIRLQCIQLNSELTTKQKDAKALLRLNHIYHFLQDINYDHLKNDIDIALKTITPLEKDIETLKIRKKTIDIEIKNEEDKLKSEGEACIRINAILQHDFGHQHLRLAPIEVNTISGKVFNFEIHRNGTKAHNLSEGEQSLISFCYYIVKVQEDLEQNKNPILWIDDPICSLDSNHIFFIFSLIEERICNEKKFLQLFISTHNLEFLKYLRRINGAEPDRSIGFSKEENRKASYYLIQRHDSFSTIRQMPIYLSKFLTEFNFLFDQIYKCATVNQIDDSNFHLFYNFGNNARKFLEIYTFYKFPSPTYQLDAQLKNFWGEQIHKTLTDRIHNEYSHMTGVLERGETISEQPEMQKSAKAIIMKVQQEDIVQYNALLESINIAIPHDSLHPNNQNA